MKIRSFSYSVFWLTAAVVFSSDQIAKLLVLKFLDHPLPLIPSFLYLERIFNDGAAWNFLAGQRFFLIGFSLIALSCVAYFRRPLHLVRRRYQIVFGLLVGGIVGNLVDRIRLGSVVDFLDFHLPFYRWPAFNIADISLCLGVLFYIYFQIKSSR